MEIKPLLYVTSATIETNIVYPVSNFNELNKKNKFLKEVIYYKKCKNSNGDRCFHPHCQYVCCVFDKNGGYVKCGRINKNDIC